MRALGLLALTALAITGCALDANSNSHQTPCTTDVQCGSGSCYRGFCVGGIDGGGVSDTGVDSGPASPDTGVDGGPDSGRDASRDASLDTNPDADNHCDGGGTACTTSQVGACAMGHRSCGAMACVRNADPVAETCNGGDDDCDGLMDEETDGLCYPSTSMGCTRNADGTFTCVGTCRPGTSVCMGGVPNTCMHDVLPQDEGCQSATQIGLDDDCDGMVDEANGSLCTCTAGAMRQCFTGLEAQAGVGRCLTGMQTCDATGHWGACTNSGSPVPETCANTTTDDDCDGTVDNVPGIGAPCTVPGAMGVCADGVTACMSNAVHCSAPAPVAELCNHLDDDCDGSTDEGIDTMANDANCGSCGHACGDGTSCCNGMCVDETSDQMFCGMCSMSCGTGSSCCGAMCADTTTDEQNCGACGHACSGGQMCCNSACIDPLSDEANCMGCGITCAAGSATPQCCGGCRAASAPQCTGCPVDCTTLTPHQTCCGAAGSMACTDTMTDEAHCGGCGMPACGANQVCCNGMCVADDATHCGGACTTCAAGSLCCNDQCVHGDDSLNCHMCGHQCTGSASSCCADGCHNFQADLANCGSCGHACTTGQACSVGHCCGTGTNWCGSSCVNFQNDNANCGSCGHACSALYGCRTGQCVLLGIL